MDGSWVLHLTLWEVSGAVWAAAGEAAGREEVFPMRIQIGPIGPIDATGCNSAASGNALAALMQYRGSAAKVYPRRDRDHRRSVGRVRPRDNFGAGAASSNRHSLCR